MLYAGRYLVRIPRAPLMAKREDDHLCALYAIHYAIRRMQDLAIRGSSDLGHDATATGIAIELADLIDECLEPCGGRERAILGDIVDGFARTLLR